MTTDLRTHTCAHPPCACEVPLDHTYCSDHCSDHSSSGTAPGSEHAQCGCGHAGCKEPPLPDPSGTE